MKNIDRIIKDEDRKEKSKLIKQVLPIGLFIGALLFWKLYLDTDTVIETKNEIGVLVGIHQIQNHIGSTYSQFAIELKDGSTVKVRPLENTPYLKNKPVKVIKSIMESERVYYSFGGYIEQYR